MIDYESCLTKIYSRYASFGLYSILCLTLHLGDLGSDTSDAA